MVLRLRFCCSSSLCVGRVARLLPHAHRASPVAVCAAQSTTRSTLRSKAYVRALLASPCAYVRLANHARVCAEMPSLLVSTSKPAPFDRWRLAAVCAFVQSSRPSYLTRCLRNRSSSPPFVGGVSGRASLNPCDGCLLFALCCGGWVLSAVRWAGLVADRIGCARFVLIGASRGCGCLWCSGAMHVRTFCTEASVA